jgi:hypothetical protein
VVAGGKKKAPVVLLKLLAIQRQPTGLITRPGTLGIGISIPIVGGTSQYFHAGQMLIQCAFYVLVTGQVSGATAKCDQYPFFGL